MENKYSASRFYEVFANKILSEDITVFGPIYKKGKELTKQILGKEGVFETIITNDYNQLKIQNEYFRIDSMA